MKLYDISRSLFEEEPFPGDPAPEFEFVKLIGNDSNYSLSTLSMCVHNGTHMDAPLHFIPDGKSIGEVDLMHCYGEAWVVEFIEIIEKDAFIRKVPQECKRLLIKGNALVTPEIAQLICNRKMLLVGTELQTIGTTETLTEIHRILLGNEVVLLESIDLSIVPEGQYTLAACPLKISPLEASPCRAVLISER